MASCIGSTVRMAHPGLQKLVHGAQIRADRTGDGSGTAWHCAR
jgi:hypothetical protein